MTTPVFTEGSGITLRWSFRDEANQVTTPTTVKYRIDCLTTKRTVVDWTSVTTASTVDIPVVPANNGIISDRNLIERRIMTVTTDDDLDSQFSATQDWYVRNLPQKNRSITP